MLSKLSNYGIRGNCLKLIESYLTSRKQTVKFGPESSDSGTIKYGVPQGSVLGPLLFLIYINDIINCSKYCNCPDKCICPKILEFVLFADDTNIFVIADTEHDAYEIANKLLDDLQNYLFSNQLHVNFSKCTYMHFRPSLNNEERKVCSRSCTYSSYTKKCLFIRGVKIKKVDKVRFLGVIIDDKLSWEDHLQHLEARLLSAITMIKRIRKFVPRILHREIYFSLFQSHLAYGISAWGGACPSKLRKVFSLQKRCVRLLFGEKPSFDHSEFYETCARSRPYAAKIKEDQKIFELEHEHTKPLFNYNKILTIHHLYTLNTLAEAFKIKKLLTPTIVNKLMPLSPLSESGTRQLLLEVPKVSLSISKNNFFFKAAQIWNNIVPNILQSPILDKRYNLVIPGSCENSDLTTPVSYIKSNTKTILFSIQSKGEKQLWLSDGGNFKLF